MTVILLFSYAGYENNILTLKLKVQNRLNEAMDRDRSCGSSLPGFYLCNLFYPVMRNSIKKQQVQETDFPEAERAATRRKYFVPEAPRYGYRNGRRGLQLISATFLPGIFVSSQRQQYASKIGITAPDGR